jgi:HNH endonuclease
MADEQPKCALCSVTLTRENDSHEHVILNALGGRQAVNGFICDPCNNTTGHTWDAVLAKQLNALSLFFHITRQDGEPPAQVLPTLSGGVIRVTYDGLELPRPIVTVAPNGAGASIQVVARTMDEARKIVADLKRKYPSIAISKGPWQRRNPTTRTLMSRSGWIWRSVVPTRAVP